jgi:hypothetical protein
VRSHNAGFEIVLKAFYNRDPLNAPLREQRRGADLDPTRSDTLK